MFFFKYQPFSHINLTCAARRYEEKKPGKQLLIDNWYQITCMFQTMPNLEKKEEAKNFYYILERKHIEKALKEKWRFCYLY